MFGLRFIRVGSGLEQRENRNSTDKRRTDERLYLNIRPPSLEQPRRKTTPSAIISLLSLYASRRGVPARCFASSANDRRTKSRVTGLDIALSD